MRRDERQLRISDLQDLVREFGLEKDKQNLEELCNQDVNSHGTFASGNGPTHLLRVSNMNGDENLNRRFLYMH